MPSASKTVTVCRLAYSQGVMLRWPQFVRERNCKQQAVRVEGKVEMGMVHGCCIKTSMESWTGRMFRFGVGLLLSYSPPSCDLGFKASFVCVSYCAICIMIVDVGE